MHSPDQEANCALHILRTEYNKMCQRIAPFDGTYSFQTERSDNGSPHVEFINGQYHYVVTERGLDLESRSTPDVREIVFWMLSDLTFWMGVDHEFKNRIDGRDCRRIIFPYQIELMKRADLEFAKRLELQVAETLRENPFIDRA